MSRVRRGVALVALVCVAAASATACNSAVGGPSGADTGFVSGDGTLTVLPRADRGEPIALAGETLDGGSLNVEDYRGDVVVVNIWGSWCGPCRKEAPELQQAADRLAANDVKFLGLNTRDQVEPAKAFVDRFAITFPSILDPDGQLQLAFRDTLPPAAIPSTIVLDREGRVAARIIGPLPSEIVLSQLAEDVVDEGGAASEAPTSAAPTADEEKSAA